MRNIARQLNSLGRIIAALVALTTLGNSGCTASGGITKKEKEAEAELVDLGSPQSTYSIVEGSSQGVLVVLGKARKSDLVVTVSLAPASGVGSASSDFSGVTSSFTILKGEQSGSFSLQSIDDLVYEGTESFILTLNSNDKKVKIKDFSVNIVVTDNDAAPTAQLSSNAQSVTESSGAGSVAVELNRASSSDIVLAYTVTAGTATTTTDFSASAGSVTVAAGNTTASIPFSVVDDTAAESSETFVVQLSSVSSGVASIGAISSQTVTITDNDTVSLTINDVSVSESAGTATVTVSQTVTSVVATTVDYAIAAGAAPSATSGSDFTAATGTLTIAAGATSASVTVTIANDALDEFDEAVNVTLSNISQGAIADNVGIVTIIDDDSSPTLSVADVTQAEGNGGGTANFDFVVTLSAVSGRDVTVAYSTSDGTATTAGSDYNSTSGTLTIAAGQTTGTISVPVTRDTTYEGNEAFSVSLASASNSSISDGSGAGNITEDDAAPSLAIAGVSANENAGTMTLVVTKTGTSAVASTVDFATSDGTASSASDYTAASGTLTFAAGDATKNIVITLTDDATSESNETVTVTLSNASGASISTAVGTATIVDDDCAASPSISIADSSVTEGNAGTVDMVFTVTLSGPACSALTMTYDTSNATATAGTDYTAAAAQTLTIGTGASTGSVTIVVAGDTTLEGSETFNVTLSAPSAGTFSDNAAIGTITNDETVNYMWTGASGDGKWSTAGNWQGGAVPGGANTAYFTNLCTNCNANIDVNIDINSLQILQGYTGTITQNATRTINVRSTWIQNGGTFVGGDSLIRYWGGGSMTWTAGTITATTGVMEFGLGSLSISDGVVFNHANGTVKIANSNCGTPTFTVPSGFNFYNVQIDGNCGGFGMNNRTYNVLNSLEIISPWYVNSAQFNVSGNVTGPSGAAQASHTTFIVNLVGSGTQTVSSPTAGSGIASLKISSTGTVVMGANVNVSGYEYVSGTMDFATNNSTLVLQTGCCQTTKLIGGAVALNHVQLVSNGYGINTGGTTTVAGNIVISSGSSNLYLANAADVLELKGNYTSGNYQFAGPGKLKLSGSSNQTVTLTGASATLPTLEIASTGGTVNLASNMIIKGGFTFTSGVYTFAGATTFGGTTGGAHTINSGAFEFNDVTFSMDNGASYTITGTMKSLGNLVFNCAGWAWISGGGFEVGGNLTVGTISGTLASTMTLNGTGDQTVVRSDNYAIPAGTWTVNKASGSVLLGSNLNLNGAGQDLVITSGTFNMSGYNLTVADTISNSGTLQRGTNPTCGTLTYGTLTGSAAVCP